MRQNDFRLWASRAPLDCWFCLYKGQDSFDVYLTPEGKIIRVSYNKEGLVHKVIAVPEFYRPEGK